MQPRPAREVALELLKRLTGGGNAASADVDRYPATTQRPSREHIRDVAKSMAQTRTHR